MSVTALALVGLLVGAPAQVVVPGQEGAPYGVAGLTAAGDAVWFSSIGVASGRELWKSDGTAAGTAQIVDLIAGPASANPSELVGWQNGIAFVAADGGAGGTTLFRSDGTAGGTQPLSTALPGFSWPQPSALAVQGEFLLFASGGKAVWRTDGSLGGTTSMQTPPPAKDIGLRQLERIDAGAAFSLLTFNVSTECCQSFEVVRAEPDSYVPLISLTVAGGAPDPRPTDFTAVGTRVAFTGQGKIHWTDGSLSISLPVGLDEFGYDVHVFGLTRFGDGIAFAVTGNAARSGLWLSDGTIDGTRRIAAFRELTAPLAVGARLLFSARATDEPWGLWSADANSALRLRDGYADNLTAIGAGAVFSQGSALMASELWVSDATATHTGRVQRFPVTALSQFTPAGQRLFFAADSPAAAGVLWTAAAGDLAPFTPPPCAGDCNGDARVSVDELITGVGAALGDDNGGNCLARFCRADCGPGPGVGRPTIACLVSAVGALLHGCPVDRCTTDADCDDGNACSSDVCTAAGCASTCVCV